MTYPALRQVVESVARHPECPQKRVDILNAVCRVDQAFEQLAIDADQRRELYRLLAGPTHA